MAEVELVLVVEDNEMNVVVLEKFLEILGIRCRSARSGEEALDALRRERFDAVLMDIEMPVMDGLETVRRIRAGEAGEANRAITVIAVTAHSQPADRQRFRDEGMTGYISKPVPLEELRRVLSGVGPGRRGEG